MLSLDCPRLDYCGNCRFNKFKYSPFPQSHSHVMFFAKQNSDSLRVSKYCTSSWCTTKLMGLRAPPSFLTIDFTGGCGKSLPRPSTYTCPSYLVSQEPITSAQWHKQAITARWGCDTFHKSLSWEIAFLYPAWDCVCRKKRGGKKKERGKKVSQCKCVKQSLSSQFVFF